MAGIKDKTFTMIVGPEASFKSSFMMLMCAAAQKQDYTIVIIDTEGAYSPEFISRWGVNGADVLYVYTPWIDEITPIVAAILDDTEPKKYVLVLDSIGGIERLKLLNDARDGDVKADQGTLQKEIKRLLKLLNNFCKVKNSIVLASGHFYGNPSGYGDADQIGGGKYARLAPHYIISLKKDKIWEGVGKDKKVIGTGIYAVTLKNRYYPPFQEARIEINYNDGINEMAGIIDLCVQAGIIEKSGAWYSIPEEYGGERLGHGEKNASKYLLEHKELLKNLDVWLAKTGYSTINKNVEMTQKEKDEINNKTKEDEND